MTSISGNVAATPDRASEDAAPAFDTALPCLVTIYGPRLGDRFGIDVDEVCLGRSTECEVHVPLRDVSRRHCRLRREGDQVVLEDLGSTNGTFVNGDEIRSGQRVPLRSRDLVKVGGAIFRFLCGDEVETQYREELHRVAIIDGLTQIHNERYFADFMEREAARSRRHGRPLSLLLFDVDGLGSINEAFGRLAGDAVLRDIASRVKGRVRAEACFARLQNDEFAIALPELELDECRLFARILCELVAGRAFEFQGMRFAVTVSTGAATLRQDARDGAGLLEDARHELALERASGSADAETREVLPLGSG